MTTIKNAGRAPFVAYDGNARPHNIAPGAETDLDFGEAGVPADYLSHPSLIIDGKAGLLLSPTMRYLADGMEWGFRYKKGTGGLSSTTRDKTHHSHLCEAAEYAMLRFNGEINPTITAYRARAREIKPSSYAYV